MCSDQQVLTSLLLFKSEITKIVCEEHSLMIGRGSERAVKGQENERDKNGVRIRNVVERDDTRAEANGGLGAVPPTRPFVGKFCSLVGIFVI